MQNINYSKIPSDNNKKIIEVSIKYRMAVPETLIINKENLSDYLPEDYRYQVIGGINISLEDV